MGVYVCIHIYIYIYIERDIDIDIWVSMVAQMVKNLPTMWETGVWSLGQEDPLDKEMATHSSIFAWEILWREEPAGLKSMGLQIILTQFSD